MMGKETKKDECKGFKEMSICTRPSISSGSRTQETSGRRSSCGERFSNKAIISGSSTSKSERLKKQTQSPPLFTRESERVEKKNMPSCLGRSEKEMNLVSPISAGSRKHTAEGIKNLSPPHSLGSRKSESDIGQRKDKEEKSTKQLAEEARKVGNKIRYRSWLKCQQEKADALANSKETRNLDLKKANRGECSGTGGKNFEKSSAGVEHENLVEQSLSHSSRSNKNDMHDGRGKDRHKDRHNDRHNHRHNDSHKNRHNDRQNDRQKDRHKDEGHVSAGAKCIVKTLSVASREGNHIVQVAADSHPKSSKFVTDGTNLGRLIMRHSENASAEVDHEGSVEQSLYRFSCSYQNDMHTEKGNVSADAKSQSESTKFVVNGAKLVREYVNPSMGMKRKPVEVESDANVGTTDGCFIQDDRQILLLSPKTRSPCLKKIKLDHNSVMREDCSQDAKADQELNCTSSSKDKGEIEDGLTTGIKEINDELVHQDEPEQYSEHTTVAGVVGSPPVDNEQRKMCESQKGLHGLLKPSIAKLHEVLHLSDEARRMADMFLEYVMDNHNVSTETETTLQAFQIAVCWVAASLLKLDVSPKQSLVLAKSQLGFGCTQDEVDYHHSILYCLKSIFLARTRILQLDSHPKDSEGLAPINGKNHSGSKLSRAMVHQKTETMNLEDQLYVQECSMNQGVVSCGSACDLQLAKRDFSESVRNIRKKCQMDLIKLVEEHQEEKAEFERQYEEEKKQLEKDNKVERALIRLSSNDHIRASKLKKLKAEYDKKFEELECKQDERLNNLEVMHEAARNHVTQKEACWIEKVQSWAKAELFIPSSSKHDLKLPCSETISSKTSEGDVIEAYNNSVQTDGDQEHTFVEDSSLKKQNPIKTALDGDKPSPDGDDDMNISKIVVFDTVQENILPAVSSSPREAELLNSSSSKHDVGLPCSVTISSKPSGSDIIVVTKNSAQTDGDRENKLVEDSSVPEARNTTVPALNEDRPTSDGYDNLNISEIVAFDTVQGEPAALSSPEHGHDASAESIRNNEQMPSTEPELAAVVASNTCQEDILPFESSLRERRHDGSADGRPNGEAPSSTEPELTTLSERVHMAGSVSSLAGDKVPGGVEPPEHDEDISLNVADVTESSVGLDNATSVTPIVYEQVTALATSVMPEALHTNAAGSPLPAGEIDRTGNEDETSCATLMVNQQHSESVTLNEETLMEVMDQSEVALVQPLSASELDSSILANTAVHGTCSPPSSPAINQVEPAKTSETQNISEAAQLPLSETFVRSDSEAVIGEANVQIQPSSSRETFSAAMEDELVCVGNAQASTQQIECQTEADRQTVIMETRSVSPWTVPEIIRLPCLMHNDPFKIELERLRKEAADLATIHEEAKLKMKAEFEREISEIRRKYQIKQQEAENELMGKKKELETNQSYVLRHQMMACGFRAKLCDSSTRPLTRATSGPRFGSGFSQQRVQPSFQNRTQWPQPVVMPSWVVSRVLPNQQNGVLVSQPMASRQLNHLLNSLPEPRRPQSASTSTFTGTTHLGGRLRPPPHLQHRSRLPFAPASANADHAFRPRWIQNQHLPMAPSPVYHQPAIYSRSETTGGATHVSNPHLASVDLFLNVSNLTGVNPNANLSSPVNSSYMAAQLQHGLQNRWQANSVAAGETANVVCLSDDDG